MGIGCQRVGSLSPEPSQELRHKVLQHNALCRRVSGGFIADNLRVGWVRYGLESVRGADANADCGVMCGGAATMCDKVPQFIFESLIYRGRDDRYRSPPAQIRT
jgi:hypothetical protein